MEVPAESGFCRANRAGTFLDCTEKRLPVGFMDQARIFISSGDPDRIEARWTGEDGAWHGAEKRQTPGSGNAKAVKNACRIGASAMPTNFINPEWRRSCVYPIHDSSSARAGTMGVGVVAPLDIIDS